MPDATEPDPTQPSVWAQRWSRFVRHPASVLVWFCLFSLVVKEQYPFSNFPMYSSWGSRTHYFYIKADDEPIQAKMVFRVSVPRMKKLYGGILDKLGKEVGKTHSELGDADFAEAGRRLLQQLREEAPEKRRKKWGDIMDRDLSLVRVDIQREGKQFKKDESVVVTTGPDNTALEPPAPQ